MPSVVDRNRIHPLRPVAAHILHRQIPTQLLNVINYDTGNFTLIECLQPSICNRLQCSRIVRIAEPLSLYRKPAFTSIDLTETGKVSPLKIIGESIIVDQIPLQKIHQFSDLLDRKSTRLNSSHV